MSVEILSVNISEKKGTVKTPVPVIELTSRGIKEDAHAGDWNRQVSMLGAESIEKSELQNARRFRFGEFAENITTRGIVLFETHPLDRFICGELELEITQIGKECHGSGCSIFKEVGNCVMPKEGIFCRVIRPGFLRPGDMLEYIPKKYTAQVITLSDRASRGEYEDKSGPEVIGRIQSFFDQDHLPVSIKYSLLPDEPEKLTALLVESTREKTDLILTTGGTGIGPRDITPDVIRPLLTKEIPGIMEMIRLKYGVTKPNALVSRSIAGVIGHSLVFVLPGSVRAVEEYMTEITPLLKHLISMLHGLDIH
ncbi:MAG: molybdopterin-binding protein [Bacteroidetes bacterium]|nr:molybdopterin-binding protein [Bacteroidota bacterium]